MVESESRYDTRVMADSSDDEEQNYNFKTLFKHMHSESKRHNVVSILSFVIFKYLEDNNFLMIYF